MPKDDTLSIQKKIIELGNKLGFITVMEKCIHTQTTYCPIYDVIWYLDLTKYFNLSHLEPMFENRKDTFNRIKILPFAGFEIEGASTSSKNQLSNFANLYGGHFLYNFIIVNNSESNNENDTYRRGIKIHRYFTEYFGDKNFFFLDKVQLDESIKTLKCFDSKIAVSKEPTDDRETCGGETSSIQLYEKIRKYIDNTGLTIKQNYSPIIPKIKYRMLKECFHSDNSTDAKFYLSQNFYKEPGSTIKESKKTSDSLYIPKLDVALGFKAPNGFTGWIKKLGNALKNDYIHYPIIYGLKKKLIKDLFIPLISIEIEVSINKHLNGGIFNMSNYSYLGIIVTKENAESHVEFFKKYLGIGNIITFYLEG